MKMTESGMNNLREAIIQKAIEDYAKVLKAPESSEKKRNELKSFFLGPWFEMLSTLDGKTLMRLTEMKVAAGESISFPKSAVA